jgi:alanine racemase
VRTRPGITLYGTAPLADLYPTHDPQRPEMTHEFAILLIRDLEPGEPIASVGGNICTRPTRVDVVAIGYADGDPRHAVDGAPWPSWGE